MNKTRIKKTDLFEAVSTSGRIYVVTEQTCQSRAALIDGSYTRWIDGAKQYLVRSGGFATQLEENEFHMLASGENAIRK